VSLAKNWGIKLDTSCAYFSHPFHLPITSILHPLDSKSNHFSSSLRFYSKSFVFTWVTVMASWYNILIALLPQSYPKMPKAAKEIFWKENINLYNLSAYNLQIAALYKGTAIQMHYHDLKMTWHMTAAHLTLPFLLTYSSHFPLFSLLNRLSLFWHQNLCISSTRSQSTLP
jgi:hypothetical protein